jgi:hypothetical protein
MNCSSDSDASVHIGYDAVQLHPFTQASSSPGSSFTLVTDQPCQLAAQQEGDSALLYFCEPGVHIKLLQPQILNVLLVPRNNIKAVALAVASGAQVSILEGSFTGNAVGSLLLVTGSASVTVHGLQADSKSGTTGAAAFAFRNASLTVADSVLSDNTADSGAAVSADGSAGVQINNTVISGNQADTWGGALEILGSSRLLLHNCNLSDNTANDGGGALSIVDKAQVRVRNACRVLEKKFTCPNLYAALPTVAAVTQSACRWSACTGTVASLAVQLPYTCSCASSRMRHQVNMDCASVLLTQ